MLFLERFEVVMMFLLRCAFWLSVVYGSIFYSHGAFSWSDDGAKLAEAARTGAETLLTRAASGATDLCARHAQECLADAARLTALVRASRPQSEADPVVREASVGPEQMAERDIPLPIPDPRRYGRDAKRVHIP